MRPFMTLAATGIASLLVLKVLALVAVPVAGVLVGLLVLVLKIVLWSTLAIVAYMVFKRLTRPAI